MSEIGRDRPQPAQGFIGFTNYADDEPRFAEDAQPHVYRPRDPYVHDPRGQAWADDWDDRDGEAYGGRWPEVEAHRTHSRRGPLLLGLGLVAALGFAGALGWRTLNADVPTVAAGRAGAVVAATTAGPPAAPPTQMASAPPAAPSVPAIAPSVSASAGQTAPPMAVLSAPAPARPQPATRVQPRIAEMASAARTASPAAAPPPRLEMIRPASPAPAPAPLPVRPAETAAAPPETPASAVERDTCAAAATPAAAMVCRDAGLSAADARMRRALAAAVAAGAPERQLQAEQEDWRAIRELAARRSRSAVESIYTQRIDELNAIARDASPDGR